jgi:hypothetical protein
MGECLKSNRVNGQNAGSEPRGTGHAEERLKVRPEQETIPRAFAELMENIRLPKCRVNEGYLKALGLKADVVAGDADGSHL